MNTNLLLPAQIGFILLTVVFFYVLLREIKAGIGRTLWDDRKKRRYFRNLLIGLFSWLVFVSLWSGSGKMADFKLFPLNFAPVIAIPLVTIVTLTFTQNMADILHNIPPARLIRLQSFRLFVEVLLWVLFVAGLLPEQMTFEGRNLDILSGITAPLIAWLVSRGKMGKWMLTLWNVACLGLLINIVTVAILSTPSPWRVFMNEPSNTVVTYFPISWLPGFLVPLAYMLHLFSLKQTFPK